MGYWMHSILGCVSQGATKEEALTNIQDAISACFQARLNQPQFDSYNLAQ